MYLFTYFLQLSFWSHTFQSGQCCFSVNMGLNTYTFEACGLCPLIVCKTAPWQKLQRRRTVSIWNFVSTFCDTHFFLTVLTRPLCSWRALCGRLLLQHVVCTALGQHSLSWDTAEPSLGPRGRAPILSFHFLLVQHLKSVWNGVPFNSMSSSSFQNPWRVAFPMCRVEPTP